jgi:hypothetical protein
MQLKRLVLKKILNCFFLTEKQSSSISPKPKKCRQKNRNSKFQVRTEYISVAYRAPNLLQGTLTEVEGPIRLASSLRLFVKKYLFV